METESQFSNRTDFVDFVVSFDVSMLVRLVSLVVLRLVELERDIIEGTEEFRIDVDGVDIFFINGSTIRCRSSGASTSRANRIQCLYSQCS